MTFKTSYHNTFVFKILNFGVFQPVGDPQFSFAPQETNIHSPSYVTQIYKGFNLMHSKVMRPVLTPCIHGAGKSLSFKIRNIRNLRTEYEKLNKKNSRFFIEICARTREIVDSCVLFLGTELSTRFSEFKIVDLFSNLFLKFSFFFLLSDFNEFNCILIFI